MLTNLRDLVTPSIIGTAPESKIPMDPFILLPSPAIDEDVNDTLSYEINNIFPSAVGKLFDINRTTGNIVLLEEYDVDKNVNPDVIIITIEAVDQLGLSDTTMLFVYIHDLNDNVPVFTGNGSYVILLPDDYTKITGVDIGYVHADDADGSDTITYSIVPPNMYFSVDSSTGFIQLISSLPLDTENAGVFQLSIVASTAVRGNYVTATVTVFIVPFCTADAEMTCDLCNESSSNTSVPSQSTTTVPTTDPQNGPVNTCPETMCSKCGAYITNTCSSGAVPPASQPVCSTQSDLTFANLPFCWIVPLTVAVGVAAVIIGLSLYKRQQKRKTANTIKPDVTTVESIN
ncbi:cadherin-5-like [Pecten maximus]|uniref:cadherin-5-like n=1 Tax=Pecten maximus TaxID=6579 RepID=UPI0014580E8A|nr:cadherin-5-like [Pecten maximus]